MTRRHIVILGAMGVGKTTLARRVAERLGRRFRDSDEDIEVLLGESGAAVAAQRSVEALHELERAVLLGALADPEPLVVAAAASVVEGDLVRRALQERAVTIRMVAPATVVIERQKSGDHRRPMTVVELEQLNELRAEFNHEVENLRLEAVAEPEALVDNVLEWLTTQEHQ